MKRPKPWIIRGELSVKKKIIEKEGTCGCSACEQLTDKEMKEYWEMVRLTFDRPKEEGEGPIPLGIT